MALFIPGQRGIGQAVGQAFEKTFPSAIQGLIQDRLAALQRQKYEQSVGQFLPREISQLLSQAPAEERKFLWQNLPSLMQLMPQGQTQIPDQQMMETAQQQAMARQPEMAQRSSQQAPLFESPADRRARLQLEQGERKFEQTAESNLLKDYDKYGEKLEKTGVPAEKLFEAGNQILDILERNQAITGVGGRLLPTFLQTADGQLLTKLLNEIVLLKDTALPGKNSVLRLNLQKASKADIWNQPQVIGKIIEDMLFDKEFLKDLSRYRAYRNTEEEFAEKLPKDYKKRILDSAKKEYESLLEEEGE